MAGYQVTVAMAGTAVSMRRAKFDVDEIEDAMSYAALGDHFFGEFPDSFDRTLEHDGFDALIVVEVCMHGRHGEIMMRMLNARESLG